MTAVSSPRHLLVGGRLAEEVEAKLSGSSDFDVRVAPDGALDHSSAAWADSYAGFSVPDRLAGSSVRWVHAMSAGVDTIAPQLASSSDVLLTRTVGQMPERIGQYVLAHLTAERHSIVDYARQQRDRVWRARAAPVTDTRSVAVLGAGDMGLGVAGVLTAAGYDVHCFGRRSGRRAGFEVRALESAPDVLRGSGVLVCVLPLTGATLGLVNETLLGELTDAVLVNVGRGACVDEAALRSALDTGHLRQAVLDVLADEPPPSDSWVWAHDRVTLTPHVAGPTTAQDVVDDLHRCLQALRQGRLPSLAVDLSAGY